MPSYRSTQPWADPHEPGFVGPASRREPLRASVQTAGPPADRCRVKGPAAAATLAANGAWEASFGSMRLIFGAGTLAELGLVPKQLGRNPGLVLTESGGYSSR